MPFRIRTHVLRKSAEKSWILVQRQLRKTVHRVNDTANKLFAGVEKNLYLKIFLFIAGLVDTADKHSFANISTNFPQKIWNGPNGILRGPEKTDSWKKLKAENLVLDSL